MKKLKKLFEFVSAQIAKTGLSPKWVGVVSIAATIGLAALLIAIF